MTTRRDYGTWATVLACLVFPTLAIGQNSIKCESNDWHRNYCGSYGPNQVRMDRQISGSPCVQGQSWGVDGRGLWVDRGCRAYFEIRAGQGYGPGGPHSGGYQGGGGNYPGDGGNYPGGSGGWWHEESGENWPPHGNSHGGHWGSGGACFYKDTDFRGDYFCLRRGESRDSLGEYGDTISSIRTFGGGAAMVFDDRNFSGARDTIDGGAPDLRDFRVSQKPNHTWNDRISSVRVR